MQISKTVLGSALVIEPKLYEASCGFFFEFFQKEKIIQHSIHTYFQQDNHTLSKDSVTIRGMNFQSPLFAQTKLIRILHSSINNFIIDIRKSNPTYKQYVSVFWNIE